MVDNSKRPLEQIDLSIKNGNKKQKIELSENDLLLEKIKENNSEIVSVKLFYEIDNNFVSDMIKALTKNNVVEEISLQGNELNDENIKDLNDIINLNKITYLNLNNTSLNEKKIVDLVGAIKNNNSLVSLSLASNKISLKSLEILIDNIKNHSNLSSLTLYGNKFGNKGAEIISKLFNSNLPITYINIAEIDLSAAGIKIIANNLANSKLKTLDLSYNKIDDEVILFKNLTAHKYIKNLILNNTEISEKSAEAIRDFIALTPLNSLELEGNIIGNGIEIIAPALKTHSWLEFLNLNNIGLNNYNIKALVLALTENKVLKTLRLCNNKELGDQGTKEIAKMIETNNSLKNLDLIEIDMGDIGAIELAKVLQGKISSSLNLSELDLTENKITNLGGEELKKISSHIKILARDNEIDYKIINFFEEQAKLLGES